MKRLMVFGVVLAIILFGAFLWWQNGKGAANIDDKSEKLFVIPPGSTVREIGNSLKKEGLIRDPVIFFLLVKQQGKDRDIQAGDYRLSASMNLDKLLDSLTHGTLDKWVTFPEGLRAEEYAEILKKEFSTYEPSWDEALLSQNGYLFPDTYLIPVNATEDIVITTLTNNFYTKVSPLNLTKDSPNLSEIVIIASLIEREVKKDEEKPLVASVIYNRLEEGMALQLDASVQYALGKSNNRAKWWQPVTGDDLKETVSAYNTYANPGLPPTPISNPGYESIKAALNPAKTDYFYYISEDNGTSHFAKTLQEHNANIRKYLD
jgi:UPF0755 protein